MNTMKRYMKKIKHNFRKTYKNKLLAIALMLLGVLSVGIENDGTFLLFVLIFAIPLFLAKDNWTLW